MMRIISAIVFLLVCSCGKSEDPAQNGVADLRGVDVQSGEIWSLSGEWEFYWDTLLTPQDMEQPQAKRSLIHVPLMWSRAPEKYPSIGFATYRLRVLLSHPQEIALHFPPSIWSSSRIFVEGQEIAHFGKVAAKDEESAPELGTRIYTFVPNREAFEIIVQVANFEIFVSGITSSPEIGSLAALSASRQIWFLVDAFVIGALFIMGMYNLCLFMLRSKERSTLWFGVLCLCVAVYVAFLRNGVTTSIPGLIGYDERLRYYNASWMSGVAAFTWFYYYAFKDRYVRWIAQVISVTLGFMLVVVAFTPGRIFVALSSIYHIPTLLMAGYLLYRIVRSYRVFNLDSYIFLAGVGIMIITGLHDMLAVRGYLKAQSLVGFGLFGFVFCQSYLIARRFSRAFHQVEHLSENLQNEVKAQTQKLELQRDKLIEQKKELVQAHEDLQQHDEQKTRFFQNISHELRTPLTLILGSLNQAEQMGADSKPIQVASRNSKRLLRLVNQLLDFQKLSAGETQLHLRKLDIHAFLNSIARYIQPTCEQRGIRCHLDSQMTDSDPLLITADVDALEKIVFNYLSNALKFTPTGGEIHVTVTGLGHKARIQVRDTGPGIPRHKLNQLFRVFSQVDDSTKREYEGTGLGLALAKELAERMHGAVGVESVEGQGSSFWVDLPLCYDASHTLDLLVVEEDADIRQHMEDELLQRHVCESFRVVGSSQEARAILSRTRVYCVLSEATLAGEDGPTFLSHVAEQQPQTKRLLITDRSKSHRIVQKAINTAKIDRIFYKPFTSELFSVLKTLIDEAKIQNSGKILDLLVIDDEESILKSIRVMLLDTESVANFELVKDVERARQIMLSHRIRCVLVDAHLTAADGTDFLMEIAALQPDCRRIMITGESDPEVLEKAINKARIDQVLYKPLQKQDLLSRIEDAISQSPIKETLSPDETALADYEPKDWLMADVQGRPATADAPTVDLYEGPSRDETILVVDDVDDMREMIQGILRKRGYQVSGARHGEEALVMLQKLPVDLIITDWMMPRKSGPELLADLQKDPKLSGIPTILLTAKGDDVSKVVAVKEGASAYLAKPFDEVELQSTVTNLLKLKQGERTIAALNRDLTENILKRFLPPHLVNEIALGHREFINEARLSPVTILFADLCQFTRTSEELGPRRISQVLNQYFDAMTEVVFQEGGTIDKFIGDAVMVIFGAPEDMRAEDQVERACRCALRMQEALSVLSDGWETDGVPRFAMRVGVHHGPATVGMFGGSRRSDYTVIGPTVNLASRVESAAGPGEVLVTSVVRDYLRDDNWEKAGSFNLKGVGDGIALYRLKRAQKKAA